MLDGSRAVAEAVRLAEPSLVAAYPITPQTHIVETLSRWQAAGQTNYEYVRADSESAAAAMVLGAAAMGEVAYTATSSQGLLHMVETLYNAGGLELPFVMTLANRSVSAPINIWNDLSDAMAIRDTGLIMLFAESNQEALDQHIIAFRLAKELSQPVVVNLDGFLLTHTSEAVCVPSAKLVKDFLQVNRTKHNQHLDTAHPNTIGHLFMPEDFQSRRQNLQRKLVGALPIIEHIYQDYYKKIDTAGLTNYTTTNTGHLEYYGPQHANTVLITLGSIAGTIKDALDDFNKKTKKPVALLRLKTLRPLPISNLQTILKHKKYLAVLDRALSVGACPPLAADIAAALNGQSLVSLVGGLGGKDIERSDISTMIKLARAGKYGPHFI